MLCFGVGTYSSFPNTSMPRICSPRRRLTSVLSPFRVRSLSIFAVKSGELLGEIGDLFVDGIEGPHLRSQRGIEPLELRAALGDAPAVVLDAQEPVDVGQVLGVAVLSRKAFDLGVKLGEASELVIEPHQLGFAVHLRTGGLFGDVLFEGAVKVLGGVAAGAVAELAPDVFEAAPFEACVDEFGAAFGDCGADCFGRADRLGFGGHRRLLSYQPAGSSAATGSGSSAGAASGSQSHPGSPTPGAVHVAWCTSAAASRLMACTMQPWTMRVQSAQSGSGGHSAGGFCGSARRSAWSRRSCSMAWAAPTSVGVRRRCQWTTAGAPHRVHAGPSGATGSVVTVASSAHGPFGDGPVPVVARSEVQAAVGAGDARAAVHHLDGPVSGAVDLVGSHGEEPDAGRAGKADALAVPGGVALVVGRCGSGADVARYRAVALEDPGVEVVDGPGSEERRRPHHEVADRSRNDAPHVHAVGADHLRPVRGGGQHDDARADRVVVGGWCAAAGPG